MVAYNATIWKGNTGNSVGLGPDSIPKVDFKLTALVNAFHYVKVTNIKLFGGDLLW